MALTTPDYPAIKTAILRDIANLNPAAAVGVDSDHAVRASATGAAIEGLYQHQQYLAREIMPDTAIDWLLRHAVIRGLTPKLAAQATGTVTMTGTAGSAIPLGAMMNSAPGISLTVSAATVIVSMIGSPARMSELMVAAMRWTARSR